MAETFIEGDIISPGTAEGRLCFIRLRPPESDSGKKARGEDVDREVERFEREVAAVIGELNDAMEILQRDSYLDEAAIIETHLLILKDSGFHRRVRERIKVDLMAAEAALEHVLHEMVRVFESSGSLVFSQRAADIRDIMFRLKRRLTGGDKMRFSECLRGLKDPVVVLKELLPSLVMEARENDVAAFIVAKGTSLSHAAILAKAFGIPVLKVNNVNNAALRNGRRVVVDGIRGRIVIDPDGTGLSEARSFVPAEEPERGRVPLRIWINIVDPLQVREVDLSGVEGVGLFRTEVLFMAKENDFPTEEEQFAVYCSLFRRCGGRPVTVRTLDIGGDKTLPYFSLGPQDNPYLGFRAHRIYRFHPEILITQIRAILRAGREGGELRILYPMIESRDELLFVQSLVRRATDLMDEEGIPYKRDFRQGVLVEVPSAVWGFRELLESTDFASIGTNDLLQYLFAMDRDNANVRRNYHPESPVALRIFKSLIDTARDLGKPLSVCGEIAADIHFLPLFIGLGLESISIDPHAVPRVKQFLSGMNVSACGELARECLGAATAGDVKAALDDFISCEICGGSREGGGDHEFIDPVCGMVVNTAGNTRVALRGGKKYYFCSSRCLQMFIREGTQEGNHE